MVIDMGLVKVFGMWKLVFSAPSIKEASNLPVNVFGIFFKDNEAKYACRYVFIF